jgi:hypothetical protein
MSDDITTRIRNDEFKPTAPYPFRVKEPAILRKSAKELSDAEIASIPEVRAQYAADKAAYEEAKTVYQTQASACENAFVDALHEYHGMTGHPKADLLYSKAYSLGHSAGKEEIASYYDDLVELVK